MKSMSAGIEVVQGGQTKDLTAAIGAPVNKRKPASPIVFRLKGQRHAIDAVPQPGGLRAVGKDMAQMCVAAVAMDLGAFHEKAAVNAFADHFGIQRLVETGPACAALEFMGLVKQGRAAADAHIGAGVFGEILMGASALCPMLAGHFERKVRQLRAPFRIRFDQLIHDFPFSRLTG